MGPCHRSSFQVRSYEVDAYAHLNNGVVVQWYEQARLDYLERLGFTYEGLAERRQWFVVARVEVDFHRPLRTGDRAGVETLVEDTGRTSVRFRQVMRTGPDDAEAGRALTVMVFHGPDGRPIPIPDDLRAAFASGPG